MRIAGRSLIRQATPEIFHMKFQISKETFSPLTHIVSVIPFRRKMCKGRDGV